MLLHILES